MARERGQRKKTGLGWLWLVLIAIGLFSELAENTDIRRAFLRLRFWLLRNGVEGETLFALVAGVAVIAIVLSLSAALRARTRAGGQKKERAPAAAVRSAAAQPRAPLHRDFPTPEAHCVVCDNTGEDHFARDRAQRIQQLDDWLKIGLIDRAEYQVLKQRFERDL